MHINYTCELAHETDLIIYRLKSDKQSQANIEYSMSIKHTDYIFDTVIRILWILYIDTDTCKTHTT